VPFDCGTSALRKRQPAASSPHRAANGSVGRSPPGRSPSLAVPHQRLRKGARPEEAPADPVQEVGRLPQEHRRPSACT
jgi:hypothetical protein